jgi:hypothetical protein
VQALAVRNSPLGSVFDPSALPRAAHPLLDFGGASKARRDLLAQARELAGEEVRNQNAGAALELFWKLTANLERRRLLTLARGEVAAQQARLEEAIAHDLKAARERDDLALKASRLTSDDLALQAGLEQIHDQLALLLNWKGDAPAFVPTSALHVTPEVIDGHAAVALALQRRADLRLLRLLETQLDSRTLPVVQRWMVSINPLLGGGQLKTLFAIFLRVVATVPLEDDEVRGVRDQMKTVREFREKQARQDVLRQIEIVRIKYEDAGQARLRLDLQRSKLASVQEKASRDLAGEAELSPARLEVWKAEADMIQAAVDWELARVTLRQLQGTLATDPVESPAACAPAAPAPALAPAIVLHPVPPVPPPAFSPSPSGRTSGVTSGAPGP